MYGHSHTTLHTFTMYRVPMRGRDRCVLWCCVYEMKRKKVYKTHSAHTHSSLFSIYIFSRFNVFKCISSVCVSLFLFARWWFSCCRCRRCLYWLLLLVFSRCFLFLSYFLSLLLFNVFFSFRYFWRLGYLLILSFSVACHFSFTFTCTVQHMIAKKREQGSSEKRFFRLR